MRLAAFLFLLVFAASLFSIKAQQSTAYNLKQALKSPETIYYLYLGPDTKTIGPEISKLTNLKKLWITDSDINLLPGEFFKLPFVDEIILRGTNNLGLSRLFNDLKQLKSLKSLQLIDIKTDTLPSDLSELVQLQSLGLINTGLEKLPDGITNLTNLKSLDISYNNILILPDGLSSLTNLKTLIYDENGLVNLPQVISLLPFLEYLSLKNNFDLDLGKALKILSVNKAIKKLTLEGCHIKSMPQGATLPYTLEELHLEINFLKELNENDLHCFSTVNRLYLDNNKIYDVDKAISGLSKLSYLSLAANRLETLPQAFGSLSQSLKYLDLNDNNISETARKKIKKMLPRTKINF